MADRAVADRSAYAPGARVSTLVVSCGGQRARLDVGQALVVGRAADCDLVLTDGEASRRHLRVVNRDGRAEIVDLGSSNGTWHEGRRVERVLLAPGSQVAVGGRAVPARTPEQAGRRRLRGPRSA